MLKGYSALVLSGGLAAGLLLGLAAPQSARAHQSDEVVAFIAGAALVYALNDGHGARHIHHHHYGYRPVERYRSVPHYWGPPKHARPSYHPHAYHRHDLRHHKRGQPHYIAPPRYARHPHGRY